MNNSSFKIKTVDNMNLVSLVIPVYNEEAIIESSLETIFAYLDTQIKFDWEIVIVNDGSRDKTGELAEKYCSKRPNLKVIHHKQNRNLGAALRTGFENAIGSYIVTYDLDLSYSPDHIGALVDKLLETDAEMVIASPYMKGGRVTGVPARRLMYSKAVNRIMSITAQEKLSTYTGMVRAFKTSFLKSLNLKAMDYEINPEMIYKAFILRARIVEIPAHLDWSFQNTVGAARMSGMRIVRGIFSGFMAGFIFRPYFFFFLVGIIMSVLFFYIFVWILINISAIYPEINNVSNYFDDKISEAISISFKTRPHAFFVGGGALLIAVQFLSLGFLSLQNKRYFDETFNLNTKILKETQKKNHET